jgi:asparagine synthase (glutamine-hydrolysing)
VRRRPSFIGADWNDRIALAEAARRYRAPPEERIGTKSTLIGLDVVGPLLTTDFLQRLVRHDAFRAFDAAFGRRPNGSPLERVVYASTKVSLPGDMLVKVDRMSMANSLEVRVPLLDHLLAEVVAQVPVSIRFPRFRLKALLKDVMADVLPPEILRRPKRGFAVPVAEWFRGDVGAFARETLLDDTTRGRGFFDGAALETIVGSHARGKLNIGHGIWSLLMFELWCREVLD